MLPDLPKPRILCTGASEGPDGLRSEHPPFTSDVVVQSCIGGRSGECDDLSLSFYDVAFTHIPNSNDTAASGLMFLQDLGGFVISGNMTVFGFSYFDLTPCAKPLCTWPR